MIKLVIVFAFFSSSLLFSDDLQVSEDFKEGDVVSAETFNQIFDVIEKVNRTITDEDLLGTWTCSAVVASDSSRSSSGWTDKGFAYILNDSQLNFTSSFALSGTTPVGTKSVVEPYSFSTSNPNPLGVGMPGEGNTSKSGKYILFEGALLMKIDGDDLTRSFSIDLVSPSRFILRHQTNAAGISNIVICDATANVPATPVSPKATNAQSLINLSWTDNSSDETGFKIYRKKSGDEVYLLVSTQTTTSFSDSDTSEGVTYSYYVTSYNDNGDSLKSKIVSATLDSIAPTVISTSPQEGGSRPGDPGDKTQITVNFSESVTITCPDINELTGACNAVRFALSCTGDGNGLGYGIEVGPTGTSFSDGDPYGAIGPNFNSYTCTVDKDYIIDLNGNTMSEDYIFTFSE